MHRKARKTRARARIGVRAGLIGCLLSSAAALATPVLPQRPTGALHIGKNALDLLGRMALERVPSHIVVPDAERDLMSCPAGSPIHIQVSNAYVDVTPHSLNFTPADGSLGLDALLDVSGYAHIAVHNGYGCVSDAVCNVGFAITGLNPTADFSLTITDGAPHAELGAVGVTVAPGGIKLSFDGCVMENFQGGLLDKLSENFLDLAQAPLGDKLRELVPPLVEGRLGSMLGKSGQVSGYGFAAQLTDLKMTADGIDAYAAIGVDYEGTVAACLGDGAAPPAAPVRDSWSASDVLSLPEAPTSSIMVGVSTDLLSSALSAAWQAGMMCTDDGALAKLGFDPAKMAKLVPGLPDGLALHFSMSLDQPPTIEVDDEGSIRMRVTGAELLLAMTAPGQSPEGAAVAADFAVGVRPSIDPATGAIYAELTQLSMDRMEVHAGSTANSYSLDPERLVVLLRDVVMPMAQQRLQAMPISPAAFGIDGVYTWLNEIDTRQGGLYVGLEAYRPGPASDDVSAPDTELDKVPGHLVRAGMARFQAGGSDDQTPTELLRYEWQVDDGPLMPATFARVISAPVTDAGKHTFRVRAVDLYGKASPGFAEYSFELDPTPPTLEILEQPPVSFRDTTAKIRLTGSDDRSAPNLLSYAYRVEAAEPGAAMKLVRSGEPTGLEDGIGTIEVSDLKDGSVYQVTVLLYDEAGNVTSQHIGFGAASSTGCGVAPAAPTASLGTLLLVLAALGLARRRRLLS